MKVKNYFLLLAIAMATVISSCSDNDANVQPPGGGDTDTDGVTLQVTLAGTGSTRATTAITESVINDYKVYVFDRTGNLEKETDIIESGVLNETIEDLTIGTKKIVVLTNLGDYPAITKYDDLTSIANIELEDQTPADGSTQVNFVMSGERQLSLTKGTNRTTISVERIVAKVQLGTITIDPTEGYGGDSFELTRVIIMNAKSQSTVYPGDGRTVSSLYYGLNVDDDTPFAVGKYDNSAYRTYLSENLPAPTQADYPQTITDTNIHFYVFPNTIDNPTLDNLYDGATMITLVGQYNNETRYYAFRINQPTGTEDPAGLVGNYIKRNTQHTINVRLKKLSIGTVDPGRPLDPADLEVTVQVADWTVVPTETVEW